MFVYRNLADSPPNTVYLLITHHSLPETTYVQISF